MFAQRAPWWMYLLAVSYLSSAGVIVYTAFRGPEESGIELTSLLYQGPAVARAIVPDSPAARAGIEPGDQLASLDGRTTPTALDWVYGLTDVRAGRPFRAGIERSGERREVILTLGQRTGVPRKADVWVRLGRALLAFGLAALIAFSRPHDLQARIGAWLLAEVGLFGLVFLNTSLPGAEAMVKSAPALLGVLARAPLASPGPALLFAFAALFPRPLFRSPWTWVLVWLPQLATMAIRAYYHIYLESELVRLPGWVKPLSVTYFLAAVVVFAVNARRLEDRNERRRARIVAAGTAVLIVAILPYVVMLSPGAPVAMLESIFMSPGVFVALNLLTAAFPLSIAYAVLRHRAFDISVVIRQGLQYAVARRTLLALLPALGAILALDLALHAEQPLAVVLQDRGWIYAGIGAAALFAHWRRQQWIEALDRRFFREQYDARRLLREIAEQLREASSFEQAAPRVVARIEAALHAEFAAVLMRKPPEATYAVIAAAPTGTSPQPLPAGSKVLDLIRVLGKPLELALSETGWLRQQLPPAEVEFLTEARVELIVPVALAEGRTEALLALGSKRSEEPYTREDQDLLLAIAASLSMLLDRPAAPQRPAGAAFAECPTCGDLYDAGATLCPVEGAALSRVSLPRLLADRYRLDRRHGAGGMGSVYQATDTELERRVAVKVIREDMAGDAAAAERFRREARIAAAFSHPNVVTVHDFGVTTQGRAFLVMELLDGADLRAELARGGPIDPSRALNLLAGVCSALDSAHQRNLTHRDIKPANIFLARPAGIEIPKVLDFGLAKFASASAPTRSMSAAETAAGRLVGTLNYMSPEQLRGEPSTAAGDLWALAVVAYEMLTGRYPFEGATTNDWHAAVMAGRFTPVNAASGSWQEFFSRALSSDPRHRPPTAREFLSTLTRAVRSAPA